MEDDDRFSFLFLADLASGRSSAVEGAPGDDDMGALGEDDRASLIVSPSPWTMAEASTAGSKFEGCDGVDTSGCCCHPCCQVS